MELYLTYAELNNLRKGNPVLSESLFNTYVRNWCLGGAAFLNVPSAVVDEVNQSLA